MTRQQRRKRRQAVRHYMRISRRDWSGNASYFKNPVYGWTYRSREKALECWMTEMYAYRQCPQIRYMNCSKNGPGKASRRRRKSRLAHPNPRR